MKLPTRHGWPHALRNVAVFLAVMAGLILVGSIWHIPPERGHGWRSWLLFVALLGGFILLLGIVAVLAAIRQSWIEGTEEERGQITLELIKRAFFWGLVAYVALHFITKYW